MRKTSFLQGWQSTGKGCLERLCRLPLWRYTIPAWMWSCASCSGWTCLSRRVGLDVLQKSLPPSNILWLWVILWFWFVHTRLFLHSLHLSFLELVTPSFHFELFFSHSHVVPAGFHPTCSFCPLFFRWLNFSLCSFNQNLLHIFVDLQGPPQVTASYAYKNISLSCIPFWV